MKLPFLALLLIFLSACQASKININTSGEKELYFDIIQNNKLIKPKNGVFSLNKAPFTIRFKVINDDGMFLNASTNDDFYQLEAHETIKDRAYLSSKVMAEENFNTDKDLIIRDDFFSYWFYDKKDDWYRMNSLEVIKNGFISLVEVESFYTVDKENIKISEFGKPVYLFAFLASDEQETEDIRLKYKIEWK